MLVLEWSSPSIPRSRSWGGVSSSEDREARGLLEPEEELEQEWNVAMFLVAYVGVAALQASLPLGLRAFGAGKSVEDFSYSALLSLADRQKWKIAKCSDKVTSGDGPCIHAWLAAVELSVQLQGSLTGWAERTSPLCVRTEFVDGAVWVPDGYSRLCLFVWPCG